MRDRAATRRRILDAAYTLFYRRGYARVGVDAVAEQAGVTKRTLYDHFPSKDELLAAVFELHHELALKQIERWGGRASGNAAEMIDALFADLARWAAKPRWSGPGFTRLVMELADLPGHPARAIARRHKAMVEAWFEREFIKRKVKAPAECARSLVLLLEGANAMVLIHGDGAYIAAAAEAAKRLLKR